MKTCSRCREKKPLEAFAICRSKHDGRQTTCRECRRAYRAERSDAANAYAKAWYEKNKDRHAAYMRDYCQKNKDALLAKRREEKWRAHCSARQKAVRERLADSYIKRLLKRSDGKGLDLPAALIEAKRLQLLILRELKGERHEIG